MYLQKPLLFPSWNEIRLSLLVSYKVIDGKGYPFEIWLVNLKIDAELEITLPVEVELIKQHLS